jgi:hypothetical protein
MICKIVQLNANVVNVALSHSSRGTDRSVHGASRNADLTPGTRKLSGSTSARHDRVAVDDSESDPDDTKRSGRQVECRF